MASFQQGLECTSQSCWKTTNHSRASCFIRSHMTSQPHCLKKTSSMQSKRCDLHHTRLHHETNEKLSFYCYSPRWITTTFFYDNQPTRRLSAEVLFPLEENSCSNQRKKVTTNINNSKTNCKRLIKKIGIYEVSTRSNTTQVNNAFCACWLASSEVNSKYYLLPIFFSYLCG